ncbi:MAG: polysaccharide biosynthesis tyrosine autokinase [Actinomycetota bacterium]
MELREYLQILRRRRWIVVGTLVAVLAGALVATLRMTPIYEATARVEVQSAPSSSSESAQLIESMVDPTRRLATQVELVKGEGVLARAAETLRLPSIEPLRERLEVDLVANTQIVEIAVRHERPDEARDWANAVADAYIVDRRERSVERTTLAIGPLDRAINTLQEKIGQVDKALQDLNASIAKAQADKATLSQELTSVQEALEAQRQPPPADPTLLARVEAVNRRMTELDAAIAQKSQAEQPTGPEEAEKDRLSRELNDLQKAVLEQRTVPPQDPALVQRTEELKAQITGLDAQAATAQSQLSGPTSERNTALTQLTALQVQRQSLPDPDALRQSGGAVIRAAETPEGPASPKMLLNLALALVLGSMLGVGLAFLAENLDDRVRTQEEVEERVGAPVLGHVPYVEEWGESPEPLLATVHEPTSGAAEAYRTLRTNLRFLSLERPLQTVLVTSTLSEEGKSTTAANLAVALAEGGMNTVLVSADLRRPTTHRFFDLTDAGGIVAVLDGAATAEEALVPTNVPNLRVLTAGGRPPNPTEILSSSRFGELLESLASVADIVLIDAPPVLGLADASALASKVDGVLFVVDMSQVPRRSLSHAAEQVRKAGGRVLGTVMNSVEAGEGGYGYYYQNYYYGYSDDGPRASDGRKAKEAEVVRLDEDPVRETNP